VRIAYLGRAATLLTLLLPAASVAFANDGADWVPAEEGGYGSVFCREAWQRTVFDYPRMAALSAESGTVGPQAPGLLAQSLPLPRAHPPAGFALSAQTRRLSFYTRGTDAVAAQRGEEYLERVERVLGQPFIGRAEYYRYRGPEEIAASIGVYASGVTFPLTAQIHSTQAFHPHEIVHLVAGQLGDPGPFFHEGLAVAIGGEGTDGGDLHRLVRAKLSSYDMPSLLRFRQIHPTVAYPVAGSFVATLIKRHGIPKVVEFFRACASERDRDEAFASTFGQTIGDAWKAWAAGS